MSIITTSKTLRPRESADFYPTPITTCHAALSLLPATYQPIHLLDPGAGGGVWGDAARARWPTSHLTGIELREVTPNPGYATWFAGSFLPLPTPKRPAPPFRDQQAEQRAYDQYQFDLWASQRAVWRWPQPSYDGIIGNPPYKYAEPFVRASLAHTRPGGFVVFLLRLAFLEGQERGVGLWRDHPPQHIAVCSQRPSFTGNGKTDATAYAVFVWQRGWFGVPSLSWLREKPAPTRDVVLQHTYLAEVC